MDLHGYGLMFLCNNISTEIKKKLDVTVVQHVKKEFQWSDSTAWKAKKHPSTSISMSDILTLILGVLLRTVTENVNQILNSPPKGSKMHFLQVFERIRNGDYKRVAETNKTIKELCKQKSDFFFIEPRGKSTPFSSSSEPNMYARDGIHFNNT